MNLSDFIFKNMFKLYQVVVCQNDQIFTKISELCQGTKCSHNYLVKLDSLYFFSSSVLQQSHHLLLWHAIDITSSLLFF